jgi:acetyl esterase/lipase
LRVGATTAALLPEFFPNAPVRPLLWVSPPPRYERITFTYRGGTQQADLYLPATGGRRGAVIVVLGVRALPPEDPQVVRLLEGFARAGLVAMLPISTDLYAGNVFPQEVDALVRAFETLASRPEVDPTRIGYVALSVGAGLVLCAVADARIRDRVAVVAAFGGYYDARTLFAAIASHTRELPDGTRVSWEPDPLAKRVILDALINTLPDEAERSRLNRILITGEEPWPELTLAQELSPDAQTVLRLASRPSWDEALALWEALPASARADWQTLSPRAVVQDIRTFLVIMHDVSDPYIPAIESRRLAAALPPNVPRRVSEFNIFRHVMPSRIEDPVTLVVDLTRLYLDSAAILGRIL